MSGSSPLPPKPVAPSLFYQRTSAFTLGFIGALSKAFTFGFSQHSVHGLDRFLEILDERQDCRRRTRGLITVSNHISIIDDPLIWAFLPFRYLVNPSNMRWSLGSYDLCYKNKISGNFFFSGQVLPTHRLKFSPLGGPFQPTIQEAIRLLSSAHPPINPSSFSTNDPHSSSHPSFPFTDPFSTPSYTYTTNNLDSWPSPSSYSSNRHSWIHIFPEGRVHQHPDKTMRYFRWGIARLILEADECPDIIPMWIEGYNQIYPEDRTFLRPVPRVGKKLEVWFGANVAGELPPQDNPFLGLRKRWQDLVRQETTSKGLAESELATLPEVLQHGREAVELRIECTRVVRDAVLKLRRERGLKDEDPKSGLVETWAEEGPDSSVTGRKKDGSLVADG